MSKGCRWRLSSGRSWISGVSAGIMLGGSAASPSDAESAPLKPNIIILLADDLGVGDVQCYNPERGKIMTPHLDRLAAQGLRFTDGHSSSGVCSPSRYSLLTGRYSWRSRLQRGVVPHFGGPPLIAPERLTIAGLAREQGYRTACIGKWHLGWNWPFSDEQRALIVQEPGQRWQNAEARNPTDEELRIWFEVFSKPIGGGPLDCGFDYYFGVDAPNYPPYCFIENNRTVGIPTVFLPPEKLTKNQASFQGPALPEWQLEAVLPALGDPAENFIIRASAEKTPFLLYLPLTSPHTPLAVNEPWRGRSGLNDYADLVMETDAFIGHILAALEKAGQAENTLVIFTSDNGVAPYIGVAELEEKGHFSSGELRGYKASAWEGGHRVPFIVRWPGVIQAGRVCTQLVQQVDLMASFAEIFGVSLPDHAGEDSFSLLPLFKGEDRPVRDSAVNCSLHGVPAVRSGDWKLILDNPSHVQSALKESLPVQLYNLAADPGEKTNLAAEYPERVEQMISLYDRLVTDGRSRPGARQLNDVAVVRYPRKGGLK